MGDNRAAQFTENSAHYKIERVNRKEIDLLNTAAFL